jgi:hypothetical protein
VVEKIQRNGQAAPGFTLGNDEAARFRNSLDGVLSAVARFSKSLTPREMTVLRLGLAASHLEESIVQGDWKRADAHADNIAKLMRQLEGSQ